MTESDEQAQAFANGVFYCLPHNGEWVPEGMPSAIIPSQRYPILPTLNRSSFLPHSFNMLWAAALNRPTRPHHWAMHHADMSAEPGWFDVLLDIMREHDADVVSCVAAIKDNAGDTNAAVVTGGTVGGAGPMQLRRLKVAECDKLPDVFDSSHVGGSLLVNTGLWVVRFDRPWAEEFPGFVFSNKIVKLPDGKYEAQCMSEDWAFSLWAHTRGLKVLATTRVQTLHFGQRAWKVGGPRGA